MPRNGEVSLSGIAQAADGPGDCSGSGADAAGPAPVAGRDRISPRKLRTLLHPQDLPR